jgi:hypothetical protein
MRITPVEHGLEDLIGANEPGFERTKGLHMSELYGAYYKAVEPERFTQDDITPDIKLKFELGFALERMLEEGLKERLALNGSGRPGEFVEPEHGIIYSPDLLLFNGVTRLGEIKLTWMSSKEVPREAMSSNGFPPRFDKYFTQMKLYCRALEICDARLIAFFVNGDYAYKQKANKGKSVPSGPELLAWDLQFTRREMDEEWRTIMNHAKHVGLL